MVEDDSAAVMVKEHHTSELTTKDIYEAFKETLLKPKEALLDGNSKLTNFYLSKEEFPKIWEELLYFAMVRKNCHVSKLVMVQLIQSKILTRDELALKVSIVDHKMQRVFLEEIREYAKSGKIDEEINRLHRVRNVVHQQLTSQAGVTFLNPNEFES